MTGVDPPVALTSGGARVMVRGVNFAPPLDSPFAPAGGGGGSGTLVRLGGLGAPPLGADAVTWISAAELLVVAPAGAPGAYPLCVSGNGGVDWACSGEGGGGAPADCDDARHAASIRLG